MKIARNLVLAGAVLTLGACACPTTSDYYNTPYGYERTAGSGNAVYDGNCRVVRKTTTTEQVRTAEPVFEQRARK